MENEVKATERVSLKTADEILSATERVAEGLLNGTLEPRTANAINATLKGATKLRVEYPLKYMAMVLQARIKKINDIPQLPAGVLSIS